MPLKRRLISVLDLAAAGIGARAIAVERLPDHLRRADRYRRPSYNPLPLPEGAAEVLRPDHPRLAELRGRYRSLDWPVTGHSLWTAGTTGADKLDLQYFRGDNPYVYQYRSVASEAELRYVLNAYYIEKIDALGLLGKLEEDGLFGAYTFDFNGKAVSRDLLDSINELMFLERHLGLSSLPEPVVLDIGAGYGRLAHRAAAGLANIGAYVCTDAVAESTFLSEYYLQFRGVAPTARAVPLDEIEQELEGLRPDLAVNIHSFSECTLAAIEWWLDLLVRHRVRHLMIIPNTGDRLLSRETDRTSRDFAPLLESRGYRLVVREPKFLDATLQSMLLPTPLHQFLFRLSDS